MKTELKETESERLVEQLPILRKDRQRGKQGEVKTARVKLLCHAILALSKGCSTSLMSTTFQSICIATPCSCLELCPQSLITPIYTLCVDEAYAVHMYVCYKTLQCYHASQVVGSFLLRFSNS